MYGNENSGKDNEKMIDKTDKHKQCFDFNKSKFIRRALGEFRLQNTWKGCNTIQTLFI